MAFRTEKDLLGTRQVNADALYGIYTLRAVENFPLSARRVHSRLISAYGAVKLACAKANHELGYLDDAKFSVIAQACAEMQEGTLDEHIIVDALQGGAGTSTNMNVNEVLANRAIEILGGTKGDYSIVDPLDDINLHQSTNDTYPTALRVACLVMLGELERAVTSLQEEFQQKEKQFADIVKVGRTQYQDAVLTTLGREFSAYGEAFTRDRWRIYKCFERLRVVNLGGTAIGTGLGAPRQYIFRAVDHLRDITSLGIARAENLVEATQNADVFVEVSGILKALASNLIKVCTDLRLMSSGPQSGFGEIKLPELQAGSSIMPEKVNPVIPEAVTQAAIEVMGKDMVIAQAASMGSLELNAFYPLIADAILTSLGLLTNAVIIFREKCVAGIEANRERCRQFVETSTAILTALVEPLGYAKAQEIAAESREKNIPIRTLLLEKGLMTADEFDFIISPQYVTRLGSRTR